MFGLLLEINTMICYTLLKASHVQLEILKVTGEKVITLIDNVMSSGYYSMIWNGRDSGGKLVSSGIYLCRIHTRSHEKTMRMLFIK